MREYLLLKYDKHLNPSRLLIYEVWMRDAVLSSLIRFSVCYSVFTVYCSVLIVQWCVISGQYKLQCEDSI